MPPPHLLNFDEPPEDKQPRSSEGTDKSKEKELASTHKSQDEPPVMQHRTDEEVPKRATSVDNCKAGLSESGRKVLPFAPQQNFSENKAQMQKAPMPFNAGPMAPPPHYIAQAMASKYAPDQMLRSRSQQPNMRVH
jgi:hypothetical protein